MKKGINIWSFPDEYAIHDCIRIAKDAGFDGIELSLNETGPLSLQSSVNEVRSYRNLAEDVGIQLTSLASGLYWKYSLTSIQAAVRQKAMDIVKRQLEYASILHVDTILVVPGAVGVDFIPTMEIVPYEEAYDYALDALSRLAEVAKTYGVVIGIENVWNKFLLSPLEMRGFLDTVNSEYVGSYFDVGNVLTSGYPEHWIRILASRIRRVHFKDYRRDVGGLAGFVDLLSGDVNYPEVIRALNDIRFDSFVIAEMIPPYRHYADQLIYNTSLSMDRILGRRGI